MTMLAAAAAAAAASIDDDIYHYNGSDVVPKRVHHVRVDPSVTAIPDDAFANCRFLRNIELPEGLQAIRNGAFRCCGNLTRITIPLTVTEIGERTFRRCINLEEVILPDGLQRLGRSAFSDCCSLETICIPPLVQTIEEETFEGCHNLRNVILSTGVREINRDAFQGCEALVSLNLPSSLEVLRKGSFSVVGKDMTTLPLPDSVKRIERGSFNGNNFLNFRVPPLVTKFDMDIFRGVECIVSIELSESVKQINSADDSMEYYHLRNIAFPVGCTVDESIIGRCHPLVDLDELQERFDGLPVHKICYYHSFHDAATVMKNLKREIRKPKAANHQDCLGMTPLHILACSTKHDLEMYQLLVERYPEHLITKDRWGDIPLLYAFWCNAPEEIIHFLLESYQANHPQFEFEWYSMIYRMVDALSPPSPIQNLLNTHQQYFPQQSIDMTKLVLALAESDVHQSVFYRRRIKRDTFRFLLEASVLKRVDSLKNNKWRAELERDIELLPSQANAAEECTMELFAKVNSFEVIKDATSLIELALWKATMSDRGQKKMRTGNDLSYRKQCRVNCGAEIVIKNVLPYLWCSPCSSGS
ncbi:hypothetical protein ACHAXH_002021 [Discostella pseudostelligera]